MPVTVVGRTNEIVDCAEELPRLAVMVATSFLLKLSAGATNVALLEFAPTVNEDGTVRSGMLEVSPTVTPPEPAGPLRFTVHVEVPLGLIELWLQLIDEMVKTDWTVCTVAPVPDVVMPAPPAVAPIVLVTVTGTDMAFAASVRFTVATTPLAIVVVLSPAATQVCPPELVPQVIVLLAEVNAGPATTDKEATSVEYPKLH